MSQPPQGPGFPPPGGQPPQQPWPGQPGGQNPFAPSSGKNPFGDQSPNMNPYAPGMTPPTPTGHDPALGMVVPINTSIWAIAAGYLGLLAPIFLCLPAPFAIFCGVMALLELRRKPGMRGHVRAIVGIVLGSLGLVGLGVMLLVSLVG